MDPHSTIVVGRYTYHRLTCPHRPSRTEVIAPEHTLTEIFSITLGNPYEPQPCRHCLGHDADAYLRVAK